MSDPADYHDRLREQSVNIEYYKTLRQFLPNRKTFWAVPARSPCLGVGNLAVVRVLQDPDGDCRISVESRLVHVPAPE